MVLSPFVSSLQDAVFKMKISYVSLVCLLVTIFGFQGYTNGKHGYCISWLATGCDIVLSGVVVGFSHLT